MSNTNQHPFGVGVLEKKKYKHPFGQGVLKKYRQENSQPLSGGFGRSIQTDIMGRPFLTYTEHIPQTFLNKNRDIQSIDSTRVAPTFDFTKPQKITRDMMTNGRIPVSVSQKIRQELGAGYSDELDHQIAVSLSGSNRRENLNLISKKENRKFGTLEQKLGNDVISGKISLLDAQREIAKKKGFQLQSDRKQPNFIQRFLLNTPSILKPMARLQEHPLDTIWSGAKKVFGWGKSTVKNPKSTAAGAGVEIENFGLGVAKTLLHLVNGNPFLPQKENAFLKTQTQKAINYLQEQGDAFEKVVKENISQNTDSKTAYEVGKFVGQFIPYSLTIGVMEKAGMAGAENLLANNNLKLKAIERIGKLTKAVSGVSGFLSVGQIEYNKTEGSRLDRAKNDLLMYALFEAGGTLFRSIKSAVEKVIPYIEKMRAGETVKLSEVSEKIAEADKEIRKTTDKDPDQILKENLPELLKEPLDRKQPEKTFDNSNSKTIQQAKPSMELKDAKELNKFAQEQELAKTLRGTKGMTADQIMDTYPNIKLKKDITGKDIYGHKIEIDKGEKLTPYELKNGKILLQDGETYIVSKNQFQNIKGNSVVAEGKPFAPELEGLEESVLGMQHVLETFFYRFISKSLTQYINDLEHKAGYKDFDYAKLSDERAKLARKQMIQEKGFFLLPSELSVNVTKNARKERSDLQKTILYIADKLRSSVHGFGFRPTEKDIDILLADEVGKGMTRQEAKEYLMNNEQLMSGIKPAKYHQYTLPDGKNYREILIKAPKDKTIINYGLKAEKLDNGWMVVDGNGRFFAYEKTKTKALNNAKRALEELKIHNPTLYRERYAIKSYKSPHYDEPNILAHLRINERTYKGKPVTFLEELQSDWAKDLRTGKTKLENENLKNWQEIAIKRALQDAVNNNSKYFAWINGEQTSARYNLGTHLDSVRWDGSEKNKVIRLEPKKKLGTIEFQIKADGTIYTAGKGTPNNWIGKKLDEVLGKGLADKIMSKSKGKLSGEGLKFGGTWANNLYDKQVPNIVKKLTGANIIEMDMGLPIKEKNTFKIENKKLPEDAPMSKFKNLTEKDLRVGLEFFDRGNNNYIITDVIGGGKFKAVLKKDYLQHKKLLKTGKANLDFYNNTLTKTFDVSNPKMTQQGIKLTPEVIAKIKGKPPVIKTSGKMFEESKNPKNEFISLSHNKTTLSDYQRIDTILEQSVKEKTTNMIEKIMSIWDLMKKAFNPINRDDYSKMTASTIRKELGRMARQKEITYQSLINNKKIFDKMSKSDAIDFMDKLERGKKIEGAEKFVKTMRDALDSRWHRIQKMKQIDSYIENYFPHIWKDPQKAEKTFARYFGKRPFEGTKGFLKQRKIPTIKLGIELGLEPISYNPFDIIMAKIVDMDRFIMANNTWESFKKEGLAKFFKFGEKIPKGWGKVNDNMSKVFYKPSISEYYDPATWDVLDTVAKNLGIKQERVLTIKEGRGAGISIYGTNIIKTKVGSPEDIILHEIGHQIDFKFNLRNDFINQGKKFDDQMTALADLRYEGQQVTKSYKEYVRKDEEKIAVMFQAYIRNKKLFKKTAPDVYKKFIKFIGEHEETKPLLKMKKSLVLNKKTIKTPYFVQSGSYYMPEKASDILNNYLSPGLVGNPIYDGFRMMGNTLNQAQLGLSAFHAMFTSGDVIVSKTALGIQKIFQEGKTGVKERITHAIKIPFTPLVGPVTVFRNIIRGNKLLKDYYRKNPEIPEMIDALEKAGGRVRMDRFWMNNAADKFMTALRGRHYLSALVRTPGALIETLSKPLLQELVPRQKLGVFSDMATHILEQAKKEKWSEYKTTLMLQEAWDSVDNRMGQLVYDNLFWNKIIKDIGLASVRSMGWNIGNIRELGGGAKEWVTLPFKLITKKGRSEIRMTPRMAYTLALPYVIGIYGAITNYLCTGEAPKSIKDIYFPRTGRVRADGTPERISIPSYMKDVAAYSIKPIETVFNKLHPEVSAIIDMLQNKDYYGAEIRNPNNPIVKQLKDLVEYQIEQFVPFSVRGYIQHKKYGEDVGFALLSFIGINPAAGYISETPLQRKIYNLYDKRSGGKIISQSQRENQIKKTNVRVLYWQGEKDKANQELNKLVKEGIIKNKKLFIKNADLPSDVRAFRGLPKDDQEILIKGMELYQLNRYVWYANKDIKNRLSTLSETARQFVEMYKNKEIKKPIWKKGQIIKQ